MIAELMNESFLQAVFMFSSDAHYLPFIHILR